jgi:hypothetical protein
MSGGNNSLGSPLGRVGYDLARSHLQQLQTSQSFLGARPPAPGPPEGSLAQLTEWTNANKQHIENAVAKGPLDFQQVPNAH